MSGSKEVSSKYVPRHIRLAANNLMIPAPSCPMPRFVNYFVTDDGQCGISEFESFDVNLFLLSTQVKAGVIPQEVNSKLIVNKLVDLDHVYQLQDILFNIEKES